MSVADDIARIETSMTTIDKTLDTVRETVAGLVARVEAHDVADQQRHEELRNGQVRVEAMFGTLLHRAAAGFAAILVLALCIIGGLAGVAVSVDGPGGAKVQVGTPALPAAVP